MYSQFMMHGQKNIKLLNAGLMKTDNYIHNARSYNIKITES